MADPDSIKKVPIGTEAELSYDEKGHPIAPDIFPPAEWLERLKAEYSGQHGGETLPAGCDVDRMAIAVLTLNVDESTEILESLLVTQKDDYTIDQKMLSRVRELLRGNKACEMEQGEWAYEICKRAGLYHNWSPYAEVRAVTLPYDDADEPCESFRAYFLGYFWVCVCTCVNTCKPLEYALGEATVLIIHSLRATSTRHWHSRERRAGPTCSHGSRYGLAPP